METYDDEEELESLSPENLLLFKASPTFPDFLACKPKWGLTPSRSWARYPEEESNEEEDPTETLEYNPDYNSLKRIYLGVFM